jgi:demethylmenaquinone methyltransferase / 2-methoxy-6-polyprenyl-1,4-benzoquinol methylase
VNNPAIRHTDPVPPHPTLPDYYGSAAEREHFVRGLFDETAPWYEKINVLLSFGSGGWYRRDALRRAGYEKGTKLLDVATGTGVVARAAVALGDRRDILGLDPSIGMLLAGRREMRISGVQAFGEKLPFRSGSFGMLSIGYALRHMSDLKTAFSEHIRVLEPGGRIVILEITPPKSKLGFAVMRIYMNNLAPAVARMLSRNDETVTLMKYYWDTIRECVPPETILTALREAGFEDVKRSVSYGVMTEYTGTRPEKF